MMQPLVKGLPPGLPSTARPALRLSGAASRVGQSPLRELLPLVSQPGLISLALGMPSSRLFPSDSFQAACEEVLRSPESVQYGIPSPRLKEHIVALMAERGVRCTPEQVFLTAGAQQGLSLLAQLLLDPGAKVVAEQAIYDGMQLVLRTSGASVVRVRTCAELGMDLDALESLLEKGHEPAFIYAIPEGHNPIAVSMSREARERLLGLARRWRVPLVEDDAYGFLRYDDDAPPPLRALDEDLVFYLGSFSKILAPALRVGWIVAPAHLVPSLSALKQASDFDTASLVQRILARYLDDAPFLDHVAAIRRQYRQRRDALLDALGRYLRDRARWHRPASGLFLWLELPPAIDSNELLEAAVERERVAFLPGRAFACGPGAHLSHCLRLSFGSVDVDLIDEAVQRLARAVTALLARSGGERADSVTTRPGLRSAARQRAPIRPRAR